MHQNLSNLKHHTLGGGHSFCMSFNNVDLLYLKHILTLNINRMLMEPLYWTT